MESILQSLPGALLPWYEKNKRQLPWRQDRDPYRVWLSEIMLQQTRVEAVKRYYARFLQNLPGIQSLANCDDDRLHKLWEGLGYYSRVRNLKKAAQIIVQQHGGHFPQDHGQVLDLPGIGEYTAGAICSICFDLPTPAVDGNVLRVLSRILNDHTPIDMPVQKKRLTQALKRIYPPQAGAFTQALMELGATLCGPNRAPECHACPCRTFCRAKQAGTAQSLPVKSPKKERRREGRTVFILHCDGRYALTKRPAKGLLAGLWQFPDVPGTLEPEQALDVLAAMGLSVADITLQRELSHIFTHVQWDMRGFYVNVQTPGGGFCWVGADELNSDYALPTAYRQFWQGGNI